MIAGEPMEKVVSFLCEPMPSFSPSPVAFATEAENIVASILAEAGIVPVNYFRDNDTFALAEIQTNMG
jgi:hypothetical protein